MLILKFKRLMRRILLMNVDRGSNIILILIISRGGAYVTEPEVPKLYTRPWFLGINALDDHRGMQLTFLV